MPTETPVAEASDVEPSASEASLAWESRALERSLSTARDRSTARAHRLVDAARELTAASGSQAFTVADVAARAGVSLRSFYRHFSGKDDLLLALFEEEARLGARLLAEAVCEATGPLERLRTYVVGLFGFVVADSGYASLLVREHLQLGERRPEEMRAALAPLVDMLDVELAAAAAAGDIRPVNHHDAIIVFSLILSHVHAAILFAPGEDMAKAAARLWEFSRAGLAPGVTHR
ncbi:MAG TPA: helix-turn-helix domain-containing protein [Acidimicrobiia bacterium]|nr:helix-turn-helix domain-containing protein [Acidimicrobiia bacterium]